MPLGVVSNHQFVYLYVDRRQERRDVSTEAEERKEKKMNELKLGHYFISSKQTHYH